MPSKLIKDLKSEIERITEASGFNDLVAGFMEGIRDADTRLSHEAVQDIIGHNIKYQLAFINGLSSIVSRQDHHTDGDAIRYFIRSCDYIYSTWKKRGEDSLNLTESDLQIIRSWTDNLKAAAQRALESGEEVLRYTGLEVDLRKAMGNVATISWDIKSGSCKYQVGRQ